MPTINDVARASGVSKATVSEVLNNGHRPVSARTRERVLAAAKALHYRPSAVARGLTNKRMNTIGLAFLHWDFGNAFFKELIEGVLSVCTPRHQSAMLCTFKDWAEAEHMPQLFDGRCDGILLLIPPVDCSLPEALLQRSAPFVIVNGKDPSGRMTCVDVDNTRAAFAMTQQLLGLGHRRIAFVSLPLDHGFPFFHERREGFRQTLADAGLGDSAGVEMSPDEILALDWACPERPTAAFCCYDHIALLLMGGLARQGVRVPEDISVVGFDDILAAGAGLPPLTTVRQPIGRLGARATELLLEQIDGKSEVSHQEVLPAELMVRASAAPPPSGA